MHSYIYMYMERAFIPHSRKRCSCSQLSVVPIGFSAMAKLCYYPSIRTVMAYANRSGNCSREHSCLWNLITEVDL